MMRNYIRKTNRGACSDILQRAARKVMNGGSKKGVAEEFGVDRMTLSRYVKKLQETGLDHVVTGYRFLSTSKCIFDEKMEADLSNHITTLANMFHGLSQKCCRELAYEFAHRNNVKIPDSWEKNKIAGEDWWLKFKARRELSIRSPEATSLARATAFNRPVVD